MFWNVKLYPEQKDDFQLQLGHDRADQSSELKAQMSEERVKQFPEPQDSKQKVIIQRKNCREL